MTDGPTKDLVTYLKSLALALQLPALNGVTAGLASISVDDSDAQVAFKLRDILGGPVRDFTSAFYQTAPTAAVQTGVQTSGNSAL